MEVACPDCGTVQEMPTPRAGLVICCRCGNALERKAGRSIDAALALAATVFILLIPANFLPLLGVSMAGADRQSLLGSGIYVLWSQGWVLLAAGIAACGIVLPLIHFGLLTLAIGAVRLGRHPSWLGAVFRRATQLEQWAMVDVYLIGFAVGYSRVAAFIPVQIGAGGWCFIAAGLLSPIARASLDRRTVWRYIRPGHDTVPPGEHISCTICDRVLPLAMEGRRCSRCGARLYARKPAALIRTAALVIAGYLLYLPANLFPMTDLLQLGRVEGHTIFNGIEQLVAARLWPLAILIFFTSISIPLLKLVGLTWLLYSIRHAAPGSLVTRTKLHRVIDLIGRWSMIDVFTISIFAPLMQFGQLASVSAAPGAVAFIAVVILTMFASRAFDPRLMWDAAAAGAHG